jgi:cytochrome c2
MPGIAGRGAVAAVSIMLAWLGACDRTGGGGTAGRFGDPERGRIALRQYACATCHVIPGVVGAEGRAGPSLEGLAYRAYIAGRLPNTPDNLVDWIREPQKIAPGNAMPDLEVREQDAWDMAAYLYSPE